MNGETGIKENNDYCNWRSGIGPDRIRGSEEPPLYEVRGYGPYRGNDGIELEKPQINLNVKWMAEAGFDVGDQIDVEVCESESVIRKLCEQV